MLTIIDADEAFMNTRAKIEGWEFEFQQQFNGPLIQARMMQELMMLPPDQLQAYKKADPESFSKLSKMIERMRKRYGYS